MRGAAQAKSAGRRCSCSAYLGSDGLCPHGCERFRRPSDRVRSFEKGRRAEPDRLPSFVEVDRAFKASGAASLPQTPTILVNRRGP